jgi:hypothetical protein
VIRAEIFLQGGHVLHTKVKANTASDALGRMKGDLSGGWMTLEGKYLVHPGSIAAIRFVEVEQMGEEPFKTKEPTLKEAVSQ